MLERIGQLLVNFYSVTSSQFNYFIKEFYLKKYQQLLIFNSSFQTAQERNKRLQLNNLFKMIQKVQQQGQYREKKTNRKRYISNIKSSLQNLPIMKKTVSKLQYTSPKMKQSGSTQQLSDENSGQYKFQDVKNFEEKYEMLQKLGEGSNGIVKKCFHTKKMMFFAVKKLHYEDEHLTYLKRSFHFIHEISHPSIIKYHSIYMCPSERVCYLVMEFFNHPVLSDFKHFDEQELKIIAYQLISAVSELHKKGICHRDIKPENILYDNVDKEIKIIDFGISRRFKNRTLKKELLTVTGTLYYRAPQMFSGTVYDERIDEWAIGITLYALITGKTPFQSIYVGETIENIRKNQVSYEGQIWKQYSKGAKDLIKRFLKNKQERLTAEKAKKHFWFSPEVMAHEKISISQISDDSSVKKQKKKFGNRSITMKGDGNGIWNTMKSEMEDSKKLVKSWANNDHHNEQLTNKIYESEEEDEELSHS